MLLIVPDQASKLASASKRHRRPERDDRRPRPTFSTHTELGPLDSSAEDSKQYPNKVQADVKILLIQMFLMLA
jgi:hypothetical protein